MSSKDETAHKKQHKAMYNYQPTGTLDESLASWSRHFDKVLNVRREVTVDSAREPTDSSDALSVEDRGMRSSSFAEAQLAWKRQHEVMGSLLSY